MNLQNKRTRKTIKSALGMTLGCLTEDKPRELGKHFIDKHYSQQSCNTGRWLRSHLLIEHGSNWNRLTGKCKTYTYSAEGVEYIKQVLNLANTPKQEIVSSSIQQLFDTELVTKQFVYKVAEQSKRLVHPLQNYKKEYKRLVLAQNNLGYEYDIVCSAPTLLHQFSWNYSHGHILESIDEYITNRSVVRKRLAQETQLCEKNIKKIISALFSGGKLAANKYSSLFELCEYDAARVMYLQQDQFVRQLRADIRVMWNYIKPHLQSTGIAKHTKRYITYMTPKNKWNLYFQLEREVLDSINLYLCNRSIDVFLEHDGFTSSDQVDVVELSDWVKCNTGFDVSFE